MQWKGKIKKEKLWDGWSWYFAIFPFKITKEGEARWVWLEPYKSKRLGSFDGIDYGYLIQIRGSCGWGRIKTHAVTD